MKNPLFDPQIADPAKTPDPFSSNPKKLSEEELKQTEESKPSMDSKADNEPNQVLYY